MNCGRFARILADFWEGRLSPGEQSAAEAHLRECAACRRLLDITCGRVDILPEDQREELTCSILDHTGACVCPRVESCLWDFIGGELGMGDSQLIALHLDHCAECRPVAADLAVVREVLPGMGEIEPGGCFTREVVRVTSGWRPYPLSLRTRLLAWWNRVVQSPRFSLEAAYLGTLVLVFVFSCHLLPFRNVEFDKTSWAAIQPSTKRLLSAWADTKASVSNRLHGFASAVALGDQAVSGPLSKLARHCEHVSASILDTRRRSIRGWCRNEAIALVTLWTYLFRWIPRTRL